MWLGSCFLAILSLDSGVVCYEDVIRKNAQ